MEVLQKILIILLLCCLVVSCFAVLNNKQYIPVGNLLKQFADSDNYVSTDWVNKINIDVNIPDNAILQSIIDFINQYILLPIRLLMIVGTMVFNALKFIFGYISLYMT